MNGSLRFARCVWFGLMVSLAGCGPANTPPAITPPEPKAALTPSPATVTRSDDATTAAPTLKASDDSALATVQRTLQAIELGNLVEAFEFLPPSYQSDVDGLVHEFASKMDAEVWTRLFATLRKSVEVLRTKKAFILELDLIANRPEYEPLRKHWDEAVTLLDQFASSRASDLESLRQASAKSLLPGDAAKIVKHLDAIGLGVGADLARQFADFKIAQLRATGDEHVLSFQGPRDEQPVEITYVKHDGRWLPKSLVAQWPAGIEADRAWLATLPEQLKLAKPRVLEGLAQADALLDRLLAAQSCEEFQQAVGPAVLSLALAWPRMQELARQSAAGKTDLPSFTIIINRDLTESEQKQLIDAVLKPLNATGTDYTLLSNDGKTICRLTRIAEIASLRESLTKHFALKPENVTLDAESSRITVDLTP